MSLFIGDGGVNDGLPDLLLVLELMMDLRVDLKGENDIYMPAERIFVIVFT